MYYFCAAMSKTSVIEKISLLRSRYLTGQQYYYILAAVVGLLVGLAAVLLKDLAHLISELLHRKFDGVLHNYLFLAFPIRITSYNVCYTKLLRISLYWTNRFLSRKYKANDGWE